MYTQYPITLVWDITYECNFSCKHCYINDGKKRKDLPDQRLLSLVLEFAKCGIFYLDIGGGEPLKRKDVLLKIIETASAAEIECTVATNGWYLNEKTCKELKAAGLRRILVSLDGSTQEIHDNFRNMPGAYNHAIKGITNCIEQGIETYTIATLTKANYHDISNIIHVCDTLGCHSIIIAKFVPFGSGGDNFDELSISIKDYKKKLYEIKKIKGNINISIKEDCGPTNEEITDNCHAGKFIGAVRPNGDVVPCAFFPLIIGNVAKSKFSGVWSKSAVINSLKTDDYLDKIEGCQDCNHLITCKGGCKGRAQTQTGSWLAKDPLCSH